MALNPYDQQVYDAGFKFVPQTQYLLNPFKLPGDGSVENDTFKQPTGITTLDRGGGGDGMGYTGGITGLTTNFQKAVDARTQRLEDAYNNPSTAKVLGMNMFRQDVNPVDAGEYLAAGERIPFERTGFGKMFQPQSPQEIMEQGYEPMTNIGIISAILGKADKFGTLPRADQAFITSQMGYTGPTIFGDNQSGLSKDPFGLNTRSAFGNYAERVGVEAEKLGEALTKSAAKRGLNFDASQGALVDAAGNVIDEDEYDAAMQDFINKTNLMRTKFGYYTKKTKERDKLREQDKARLDAERKAAAIRERDFAAKGMSDPSDESRAGASGRRPGSGSGPTTQDTAASQGFSPGDPGAGAGGYSYDSGGREGFGYGLAEGGRVYYMDGGLTDLVDIYD